MKEKTSGKPVRPLRHGLEFGLFRLVHGLAGRFSLRQVRRWGGRLGRLTYHLAGKKRRLAMQNMALAFPEADAEQRRRWTQSCFEHYGSYFCEVIAAAHWTPQQVPGLFTIEGQEHLQAAEERFGGYFLTTGHYGSSELALYPMALCVESLVVVARPPNNPRIDAAIRRIRGRFGVDIIDKQGAAHRMLNAQRRGGHVAVIIDQHVRPSAGVQVPFFGHPAWTSVTLAMLSIKRQVPVVHFTCEPEGEDHYRLRFTAGLEPEGDGPEARAEMTRRYMAKVEDDIRRRPELWLWMHRRWRP